jgi:16S rRNA (cytosine967-C5)-methyltransferase
VSRCAAEIEVREPQDLGTARDFDVVWVDAPCTGSGILRRHPDVRWLRQEKELQALAKVQEQVLRDGLDRVKPGGYLMYSVCSVLEEEGVARILGLSDWKDRFEIVAEWRLWPFEGEKGDGFQGALIKLAHSSQKG